MAFKYIEYPQGHELYNLTADPHELHNIYATAPRVGDPAWMCGQASRLACSGLSS